MGAVSLRLPEELERKLNQEASLSGQPRSQLIREALEALLSRRERERLERAETDPVSGGADAQDEPWWR